MAWNNNGSQGNFKNGYNNYAKNYQQGRNSRPNYGSATYEGGDAYRKQTKKHSGARMRVDKKGRDYVSAWNYSRRRGMVSIMIYEYKNSHDSVSPKSGKTYRNLMAVVNYKDLGGQHTMSALLCHETGKITIPDMGFVVNIDAPNGGYCGTFKKKTK